jgi:Ca2+-binding EF-hand superfamily protein
MMPVAALACLVLSLADGGPATPTAAAFAALGDDAAVDLVILGETRPILVRLRVMIGDRPFRSAWAEATRVLHAGLDRNGDGRLTVEEAEAGGLSRLVAPAGMTPAARPRAEIDVNPKDGVISVDELVEALRAAAGPFRLQVDGLAERRTDALFDHLDRDKDGHLTRPELAAIVGSLRRLDRDDNELISVEEVAAAGLPAAATSMMGRPARDTAVPSAFELVAGESPSRLVRFLIKKYDAGSSRGPGKLDSRLSPEEFAIPGPAFAAADANGNGTLDAEELRGYLARAPRDAIVDVALAAEANGRARAWVRGGDGGTPTVFAVRQLAEGVVEIDVGQIRIDFHVDDGAGAADAVRRTLRARFEAADANADGYLEESELAQDNGQPSPLAGLFRAIDRDGNGKLYPVEMDEYVARQAAAARGRLTLTASDEGRALFGMLDLDRDRQLGAREVLDTYTRVSAIDRDGDGRISPEEIPHHIQLTLVRGDLSALLAPPAGTPAAANPRAIVATPPARPTKGPAWFRRMDRNRDGDVSRREFLGTRAQFDRLDLDHDGLLGPDEAEAADHTVKGPGGL